MSVGVRAPLPGISLPLPRVQEVAAREATSLQASAVFRAARLVATVSTGLGLVAVLVCGWFARYAADPYQMAFVLRSFGFIGGQSHWYQVWTGRYGANFGWLAAVAAPPALNRVLPTLFLLGWGLALWLALPRVAAQMGARLQGMSRLLAVEVIVLATLLTTPALWFDLYKLTGSIVYLTPLVLGTAAVGVALGAVSRGHLDLRRALLLALLCFLSIGFSDAYSGVAPVFVAGLAVCLVVMSGPRRAAAGNAALVAAIGTAVGLVVLLRAPGNAVRLATVPARPSPFKAARWALRDTGDFLTGPVAHHAYILLAVAAAFGALGLCARRLHRDAPEPAGLTARRAMYSLLLVAAVVLGAHLPAEQLSSAPPPPRAEIIPTYAVVLFVAYITWAAGISLARLRAVRSPGRAAILSAGVLTAAVAAVGATTMAFTVHDWQAMSRYAQAVDAQWSEAQAAPPGSDVVLPPVNSTGMGPLSHTPVQELQTDPTYWTNKMFARYFGLHSVRVSAPPH